MMRNRYLEYFLKIKKNIFNYGKVNSVFFIEKMNDKFCAYLVKSNYECSDPIYCDSIDELIDVHKKLSIDSLCIYNIFVVPLDKAVARVSKHDFKNEFNFLKEKMGNKLFYYNTSINDNLMYAVCKSYVSDIILKFYKAGFCIDKIIPSQMLKLQSFYKVSSDSMGYIDLDKNVVTFIFEDDKNNINVISKKNADDNIIKKILLNKAKWATGSVSKLKSILGMSMEHINEISDKNINVCQYVNIAKYFINYDMVAFGVKHYSHDEQNKENIVNKIKISFYLGIKYGAYVFFIVILGFVFAVAFCSISFFYEKNKLSRILMSTANSSRFNDNSLTVIDKANIFLNDYAKQLNVYKISRDKVFVKHLYNEIVDLDRQISNITGHTRNFVVNKLDIKILKQPTEINSKQDCVANVLMEISIHDDNQSVIINKLEGFLKSKKFLIDKLNKSIITKNIIQYSFNVKTGNMV